MSDKPTAEPTEPLRIKVIEIPLADQSPLVLALFAIIAKSVETMRVAVLSWFHARGVRSN